MSNEVIIPDDLPGGPAAIFQEAGEQYERLGEGVGPGLSLIGIDGKSFYLRHGGQRYTLINPPKNPPTEYDGLPAQYFDFVILRAATAPSHTWYKDAFKPGMSERPDCVSTDGIGPDDVSPDPQAELCQLCPRHEWKRQENGRDGRECQDSLRLAILPMPALIKAVLGVPITTPCFLKIPAGSMKGLAEFGEQMNQRFGGNSPLCSFVTRITFSPEKKHPQFVYRLQRWLDADEAKTILELRKDPMAFRILGQDENGRSITRRRVVNPRPQIAAGAAVPKLASPRDDIVEIKATPPREAQPAPKTPAQLRVVHDVDDADPDIDALVAKMRPQPPAD